MAFDNELYWNQEFENGEIYGGYPSETALKAASLFVRKGTERKDKLLEIGGGYGRNAAYFAEQLGIDSTVIDISSTAIELGRSLTERHNNHPEFIHGDATNLGQYFEKSSYNIIFHNFCLHLLHEGERDKIYKGASAVLREGGLYVGSYLSINDPDCSTKESENGVTIRIRGKDQHFFTEEEIKRELSSYFSIESIIESSDPEKIIDDLRNTEYYFVVGVKNG